MDAQDFSSLVKASRSYRRFTGEAVSQETLEALMEITRFAPTANNMQRLRFVLVSDQDKCHKLAAHHGWAGLLKDFNGPTADELPGGYIAIVAPTKLAQNRVVHFDCGIAAQTLCLAAASQGTGACMIQSFDKETPRILGLDEDEYTVLLLVAFGPAAADEHVILEPATTEHGVKYWREGTEHHVPKLSVEDLTL